MKKIVHISFSDSTGGAAIAAFRLHEAMLEQGMDSEMVVYEKKRKDDEIHHIYKCGVWTYIYKLAFLLLGDKCFAPIRDKGHYSSFFYSNFFKDKKRIMEADIIYLHWINKGILSYKDIRYLLKKGKKVIWVMHDMFPITGGCHHSFDCIGYSDTCEKCQMLKSKRWMPSKQLYHKSQLAKYGNLYWVAPSKWLYNCAVKSCAVDSKRLFCIPNIMSNRFFPLNKSFAKRSLGLKEDKRYILFGADGVQNNPYKGFGYFVDVIEELKVCKNARIGNVELIIYGEANKTYLNNKFDFPLNYVGVINDERTMNLVYNAADLYVMTSVAENYPLSIQESIACGTRVVAFDVGGISELIDNSAKGTVVCPFETAQMAKSIITHLDNEAGNMVLDCNTQYQRDSVIQSHLQVIRL